MSLAASPIAIVSFLGASPLVCRCGHHNNKLHMALRELSSSDAGSCGKCALRGGALAARSAKRARRRRLEVSPVPDRRGSPRGACSICRSSTVTSAESPAKVGTVHQRIEALADFVPVRAPEIRRSYRPPTWHQARVVRLVREICHGTAAGAPWLCGRRIAASPATPV